MTKKKKNDYSTLINTLKSDIETISENRSFPAIDKYASFIYGKIYSLLDYFPEKDTLLFLHEPKRLAEIKGLSDKKIKKIVDSYAQNKNLRSIVSYLSPYGITLNKAVRIHERFGDKSMEVLNERPFELCDIAGFGFKTVDAIAKKIKCKPNDKMRIKVAAKYIMSEVKSEGHVYMEQQELRYRCYELLNDDLKNISVTHDEIRECIIELIRAKTLINNNGMIYLPYSKNIQGFIHLFICSEAGFGKNLCHLLIKYVMMIKN